MAKKPTASATPPAAEKRREQIAARVPPEVLAGLDRQAAVDKLSRNDAMVRAFLNYGLFPEGRPVINPEKRGVAAKVKTDARPPEAPGSRLDKTAIGRRKGPAVEKPKAAAASRQPNPRSGIVPADKVPKRRVKREPAPTGPASPEVQALASQINGGALAGDGEAI